MANFVQAMKMLAKRVLRCGSFFGMNEQTVDENKELQYNGNPE